MKASNRDNIRGHHIRMARAGLDLSIRQLAEISSVNKATIVRLEAGVAVRESTMDSVIRELEERGVVFLHSAEFNDVAVVIKPCSRGY
ncbi:MAG: hypothetical protein AAF423_09310 [Pseudomonadota bacterium]